MRRTHSWLLVLSFFACSGPAESTPSEDVGLCANGWCIRSNRSLNVEDRAFAGKVAEFGGQNPPRVVAFGGAGAIHVVGGDALNATDLSLPTDAAVTSFVAFYGLQQQAWASDDLGRTWWMRNGQWELLQYTFETVQSIEAFRSDYEPVAVSTAIDGLHYLLDWDPSRGRWLRDMALPPSASPIDVIADPTSEGALWVAGLTLDRTQTWVLHITQEGQRNFALPYLGDHPRLKAGFQQEVTLSAGLRPGQRWNGSTWQPESTAWQFGSPIPSVPCSTPGVLSISRSSYCAGAGQIFGGITSDTLPALLDTPHRMVRLENEFDAMPTAVWLGDRSTLAAGSLAGNLYRVAADINGFDRVNAVGEVQEHFDSAAVLDLVVADAALRPAPHIVTADGAFLLIDGALRELVVPSELGKAVGFVVRYDLAHIVTESSIGRPGLDGWISLFRAEEDKRILSATATADSSLWIALAADNGRCEIVHAQDGTTMRIESPCQEFAHLASYQDEVYLHTKDESGNALVRRLTGTAVNLPSPQASGDNRLIGSQARLAVTEDWIWLYTATQSTRTPRPL